MSLLLGNSNEKVLGSVEAPPILRLIRPTTFVVWLVIFCVELQMVVSTGTATNLLAMVLSTAVFGAVHVQFWYEESEQGRRFHRNIDRMRGRVYEDDETGLPNSRHFVFELRRQMMRSVRSGKGFSLVLTDISGWEKAKGREERVLRDLTRALRQSVSESDFVAHLQGSIFAVIMLDGHDQTAAEKAETLITAIGTCIPNDLAGVCYPVVSFTGYQGELEVRDYLRRAQRDLVGARAHNPASATPVRQNPRVAAA
ncbi:MAG: diguanylate cyclase [Dehalococcoidia bacterium]|nr:diguanylate cyclase [Dehalococcoidia bacterium]